MRAALIAVGAVFLSVTASAQSLEEIVATGLQAGDYAEMPAVTMTKPGHTHWTDTHFGHPPTFCVTRPENRSR